MLPPGQVYSKKLIYKLLPPAKGSSCSAATVLASSIHRGSTRQEKGKDQTLNSLIPKG